MMNFDQLHYFAKIVECGSINAAAKHCYISYTTISKSLKNLEDELGLRLFDRSHSSLSLTEDGEIFYGEIFYNDVIMILQMQSKWAGLAAKKAKRQPQKLRIYATFFYTRYIFHKLVPILKQNDYLPEYYPCNVEMIEPLLLSTPNKNSTFAFSSRLPSQSSIKPFAVAHSYAIQHLFTDSFLVYVNREWFAHTYGTNATTIDASDLFQMPYVRDVACNNTLPYYPLLNPDMPYHLTNIDTDIFSYLAAENIFTFANASQKQQIEQSYPYVKGVQVANAPEPLKIDYFFLYPTKLEQDHYRFLELVKDFFAQHYEKDYSTSL